MIDRSMSKIKKSTWRRYWTIATKTIENNWKRFVNRNCVAAAVVLINSCNLWCSWNRQNTLNFLTKTFKTFCTKRRNCICRGGSSDDRFYRDDRREMAAAPTAEEEEAILPNSYRKMENDHLTFQTRTFGDLLGNFNQTEIFLLESE